MSGPDLYSEWCAALALAGAPVHPVHAMGTEQTPRMLAPAWELLGPAQRQAWDALATNRVREMRAAEERGRDSVGGIGPPARTRDRIEALLAATEGTDLPGSQGTALYYARRALKDRLAELEVALGG